MRHALIITEDVAKIQTLSGFLGQLFSFFYITWLRVRIKLTIILLKPFFKITLVTSDVFNLHSNHVLSYGHELAKIDYAAYRLNHLKIIEKLLKDTPDNLFKNRLAIHLTYDYLIYAQVFEKIIKKINPALVITLSSSFHEQIAQFLTKKSNIKTIKLHWLTFIWLNHWLKKFFLKRQYKNKTRQFLKQSQTPPPPIKQINPPTLLSLDFFRHLKTLSPIYQALDQKNRHPWLVTDIDNPSSALKNINLSSANYLYLASFLPKSFQVQSNKMPQKLSSINNINDFLYNLSLKAAAPMIKYCQTLSQLYLASADNLFKQLNPQAIVVISDLRFCELALSYTADLTNTPSLLISPNTMLASDQLNSYSTTDKVAVVGQFIKNQLENIGLKSSQIKIVGDPRTENYHQLVSQLNSQKVFKTLNLKTNQIIALLISFSPMSLIPEPEKKAFFKLAAKAVAKNKNMVLVIKPHPSEQRSRILEELEKWGIKNAIVTDNHQLELIDLLYACSVVLQTWSMTVFEAIMMNKPVISINPFKKDYGFFVPIIKDGGAVQVYRQTQLEKWLKILVNPGHPQTKKQLKKAKKVCARFIKTPDGHTTDKVIKLLFS